MSFGPERRREDGVVDLLVAELPEDVGRVVERAVERGRGEQCRRDEGRVLDRLAVDDDVADIGSEPVAEREQVEERLEEAGDDDRPRPAMAHDVPLEEVAAAAPGPLEQT